MFKMVITYKFTKVQPVYPGQRVFMQERFIERQYVPPKKSRESFKSILEKEMQGKVNNRCMMLGFID
jgi:hypothetical protein